MKNILVINGHPDKDSFNNAIAQSYIKSAKEAGADVKYVAIGPLYEFDEYDKSRLLEEIEFFVKADLSLQ